MNMASHAIEIVSEVLRRPRTRLDELAPHRLSLLLFTAAACVHCLLVLPIGVTAACTGHTYHCPLLSACCQCQLLALLPFVTATVKRCYPELMALASCKCVHPLLVAVACGYCLSLLTVAITQNMLFPLAVANGYRCYLRLL